MNKLAKIYRWLGVILMGFALHFGCAKVKVRDKGYPKGQEDSNFGQSGDLLRGVYLVDSPSRWDEFVLWVDPVVSGASRVELLGLASSDRIGSEIRIEKSIGAEEGKTKVAVLPQGGWWQLKLYCSRPAALALCGEIDFKTPNVFVFPRYMVMQKATDFIYDRLVFPKESLVNTNGYALNIKVTQLIVEGRARLVTFLESQKAAPGQAGRTPGDIKVEAKEALGGTLFIFNRGESGGDGIPGEPYTHRAADGAHGQSETLSSEVIPGLEPHRHYVCKGRATPGLNGAHGLPGRRGGNGGAGGNTGYMEFLINRVSQFQVIVDLAPGLGGQAGQGGPGQPGGLGGRGGAVCHGNRAPDGLPGMTGPQGDPGLPGEDGQENEFCVMVAGMVQGRCSLKNK